MAQRKRKRRLRALTLVLVAALLITTSTSVALGGGDAGIDTEENVVQAVSAELEDTITEPGANPPMDMPLGEGQDLPFAKEDVDDVPEKELEADGLDEEIQVEEGREDAVETADGLETLEPIQPRSTYTVLEDGVSAVVTDFAQLKDAVEGDNEILNVYLGADITLMQNRTVIPASKPTFTLSGTDPRTGIRYTLTEFSTTSLANLVVPGGNTSTRTVTIADMNLVNQGGYYGLIGIEDTSGGVDMIVRNVDFAGRQFAYNPYGNLIFEGTNNITITQSTNGGAGEEVAEIRNVTVRGSLNITFSSTFHMFKMNQSYGAFTVEGSLAINATRIGADYGVIQSLNGAGSVDFIVRPGANVDITANTRLASGALGSLTVGEGASFRFEKTGSSTYYTVGLRQKLSVGQNATFYLKQSAAANLVQFAAGGVMEFNNPKLVTLINEGNSVMVNDASASTVSITAQYLKYWDRSRDLSTDPLYSFTRRDLPNWADISIQAHTRAGVPVSLTSNHSGINTDVMRLDAAARQIVFGQEPKATLVFAAEHEETGAAIPGFQMENQIVDMGKEVKITPLEVPGYIVTGFAVEGGGMQQLTDGYATVTPEAETVNIIFYYVEPVLEISVPVKMMFAAYEEDGGRVTSQAYNFTNHSRFDVDVSVAGVTQMEGTDSLELTAQEGEHGEEKVWLALQPEDGETFEEVSLADAANEELYIGKLAGRYDPVSQVMNFTLGGMYYGDFGAEALWPGYNITFLFEMSK